MRIVKTSSHLNGLEFLLVRKPNIWEDIQDSVTAVDAERCRVKISREQRKVGRRLFAPKDLKRTMSKELKGRGWREDRNAYWVTSDARLIRKTLGLPVEQQKSEIAAADLEPIYSYNQTDFVKDRVAVEVQFGKYAFVAYDLFVKHMAFYVDDKIDVGIELLPMKELQREMSSGPSYYESELYNLIRGGRGVPGVPLVMVGVAP